MSDCSSSKTDSYIVIIVRKLELKFDATQVEIDDTRFLFCLPVAPSAMDTTALYKKIEYYKKKFIFFKVKEFYVVTDVTSLLANPVDGCTS